MYNGKHAAWLSGWNFATVYASDLWRTERQYAGYKKASETPDDEDHEYAKKWIRGYDDKVLNNKSVG